VLVPLQLCLNNLCAIPAPPIPPPIVLSTPRPQVSSGTSGFGGGGGWGMPRTWAPVEDLTCIPEATVEVLEADEPLPFELRTGSELVVVGREGPTRDELKELMFDTFDEWAKVRCVIPNSPAFTLDVKTGWFRWKMPEAPQPPQPSVEPKAKATTSWSLAGIRAPLQVQPTAWPIEIPDEELEPAPAPTGSRADLWFVVGVAASALLLLILAISEPAPVKPKASEQRSSRARGRRSRAARRGT
jgi:hypothetical protein